MQGIQDGNFSNASDHLPKVKTCKPASEQHRKRKRCESASGDGDKTRDRQPSLVREDDLRTDKRSE